ncbi:hypothetical protein WH87_10310 [Devosia epidermidihirudinis]|uniref:HTH araC/xylS-type domain-containing protein n=1 Tax=Devosia epidermidihirudinis TaxID=1293439 RepID=A0A0F5QBB0_9HYPH|nr:helix-turn-helix transcriptional regulator [Devosia epidermidihirudinis]KKC38013.1 hypothetical protein WH87_10310 [Devosia epidermidihirudinis]
MQSLHTCLATFDVDAVQRDAIALGISVSDQELELPMHRHRKAQLVVALQGGVMCRAEGGLWMVPAGSGVWIPGDVLHSNHVTANGRISLLFVDPDVPGLPTKCCTLSLSTMVVEIINHMADQTEREHVPDAHSDQLARVVLEELRRAEIAALHMPIPDNPALTKIANALIEFPGDRSTLTQWASRVAMSERTLSRLVVSETAMSFGRWRQQLHIILALQQLSAGVTVQGVSDTLGYESVSAFITMFKHALGKPPARYIAEKRRSE